MIAQEVQSGKNVVYSDNSRRNLDDAEPADDGYFDDDDDYDDEDDDYGDSENTPIGDPARVGAAQWPPIARKSVLWADVYPVLEFMPRTFIP